jgi:hypothetical protein
VEALFELRRKTQLQSLYAGILFESALLIFGGKKCTFGHHCWNRLVYTYFSIGKVSNLV